MSATLADAQRWLREGRAAVLVELAQLRGSVPREAGTRMLVALDGFCGTIGGGHLEYEAIAQARALLTEAQAGACAPREVRRRLALGPSLGQCCGGSVELVWTALGDAAIAAWPAPALRFRLQLHGAGHVGQALMQVLAAVPCRVDWIDAREACEAWPPVSGSIDPHWVGFGEARETSGRRLAQVQTHCCEAPDRLVASAQAGDHVLIATHRHDLDERIAAAALRRDDLAWVGMIGSATKRSRMVRRLIQRGLSAERVSQLVCPIGISGCEGTAAKEPGVIAIAVAAQLLQTSAQSAHAPDR